VRRATRADGPAHRGFTERFSSRLRGWPGRSPEAGPGVPGDENTHCEDCDEDCDEETLLTAEETLLTAEPALPEIWMDLPPVVTVLL
jgi:hypothetical protein